MNVLRVHDLVDAASDSQEVREKETEFTLEVSLGPKIARSVAIWLIVAVLCVLIAPILAVGPAMLAVSASVRIKRKFAKERQFLIAQELASVVDLYAASLRSGSNVLAATRHVSTWSRGPIGQSLEQALLRSDNGSLFADSLADSAQHSAPATSELFGGLLSHLRYGTPILSDLERLAAHARDVRRRSGQQRARKLPIMLLFPLVTCVLPAYLLVTVAPVLIEAFRTITTSG